MKRIIYTNEQGIAAIIVPAPNVDINDCIKAVPPGLAYEIVDTEAIPTDRTFRNAWKHDTTSAPEKVAVCLDTAKSVSHEKRRAKRSEEFAPLDVQATVPALAAEAETKRQVIRDKYAEVQTAIDSAESADVLASIVKEL